MEAFPTKLDTYCEYYGISFFDLQLRCVFCKHWISGVELAAFHTKYLSLIWKQNVCYACCTNCLQLSARYERERYYQCSVKSAFIVDLLHKPLCDIVIRCLHCLRRLDYIEKIEHLYNEEPFHLIRCYWRGYCRNCPRQL